MINNKEEYLFNVQEHLQQDYVSFTRITDTNRTEIQGFLTIARNFSEFIKKYAPLIETTNINQIPKNHSSILENAFQKAFQSQETYEKKHKKEIKEFIETTKNLKKIKKKSKYAEYAELMNKSLTIKQDIRQTLKNIKTYQYLCLMNEAYDDFYSKPSLEKFTQENMNLIKHLSFFSKNSAQFIIVLKNYIDLKYNGTQENKIYIAKNFFEEKLNIFKNNLKIINEGEGDFLSQDIKYTTKRLLESNDLNHQVKAIFLINNELYKKQLQTLEFEVGTIQTPAFFFSELHKKYQEKNSLYL